MTRGSIEAEFGGGWLVHGFSGAADGSGEWGNIGRSGEIEAVDLLLDAGGGGDRFFTVKPYGEACPNPSDVHHET